MDYARRISIEIYRDIETPEIAIDAAVSGLEEVGQRVPGLDIIARGGLMRVSQPGTETIETAKLPRLDIEADFAMVITGRRLAVPTDAMNVILPGNIVIGNTWPNGNTKPFSLIDAERGLSPRITAKHELGHLLRFPREGRKFDGDCHCTSGRCVMHAVLDIRRDDYCRRCYRQLSRNVMRLLELGNS